MRLPPFATVLFACLAAASAAHAGRLDLQEGDHICIIGGGVAEAMQHTGWLEAYLHSRFPGHRLVIRNLGFDGDEVARADPGGEASNSPATASHA
jgi:hypothetical protein